MWMEDRRVEMLSLTDACVLAQEISQTTGWHVHSVTVPLIESTTVPYAGYQIHATYQPLAPGEPKAPNGMGSVHHLYFAFGSCTAWAQRDDLVRERLHSIEHPGQRPPARAVWQQPVMLPE